mgnify:CR=1 FL=1
MNNREKQALFRKRMQEKGLIQVTDWIPADERESYRKIASDLREGKGLPPTQAKGSVTSNQTSDQEAIAEYYRTSRAKDPKSALDRAVRAFVAAEVEPQIEAEVKRRVTQEREELASLRAKLRATEKEAQEERDRLRELRMNLDGLMTEDEYRLVRGCLHPDRAPEDRKPTFGRAFDIFSRLEKSVNRDMPADLRKQRGWS